MSQTTFSNAMTGGDFFISQSKLEDAKKYFPLLNDGTLFVYEFCNKHRQALRDYCELMYPKEFEGLCSDIDNDFLHLSLKKDEIFFFLQDSDFENNYSQIFCDFCISITNNHNNTYDPVSDTACIYHIILTGKIHSIFLEKNYYNNYSKENYLHFMNIFQFLKKNGKSYYAIRRYALI